MSADDTTTGEDIGREGEPTMSNEMTDRRVEDLYAWATAWDAEPVDEHAQRLQEAARYEFREWLAEHDAQVGLAAILTADVTPGKEHEH